MGFSCKSVSMLNSNRKRYKTCIKDRLGTTGSTFWSSWRFVRKFLPLLVWLGKVSSFKVKNLRLAVKILRSLDHCVIVLVLDLSKHGTPCRRNLTWILAKLDPSSSSLNMCVAAQQRAGALEISLRQPSLAFSAFLRPDDSLPVPKQRPRKRKAEQEVVLLVG